MVFTLLNPNFRSVLVITLVRTIENNSLNLTIWICLNTLL